MNHLNENEMQVEIEPDQKKASNEVTTNKLPGFKSTIWSHLLDIGDSR